MVVDWLLDPPDRPPRIRRALAWLLYPLVYLAYSLIRGPRVGWYPYPFLDPQRSGGYGVVAGTSLAIVVVTGLFVCLIVWVGNVRRRQREGQSMEQPPVTG
jgi:uncharacterized membrane protein